jgi:hypothetical protein
MFFPPAIFTIPPFPGGFVYYGTTIKSDEGNVKYPGAAQVGDVNRLYLRANSSDAHTNVTYLGS